jgi:hypothetical protein
MLKILQITLAQSRTRPDILDWLTLQSTGGGLNAEKHWMINTRMQIANPQVDYHIESLRVLLAMAQAGDYELIMILK